jgi:lipopolysaccharide/colanic/teichoic acid biosynthesis glycosyltransferase
VGPRPLYLRQAEQWDERQKRRLLVRPGLTGYAQVAGRGGLTLEEKIELDLYYVDNRTLWLDVRIILKTITAVFGRRRAIYERRYSRDQERENH